MSKRWPLSARHISPLRGNMRGSVLIETALSLPILVIFLIGILTYGAWFMAAHVVPLLNEITGLMGVKVGAADVRVDQLRCGVPTLVG